MRLLLLFALALPALADPVKVKDGHASGVFYGWSPVNDLWGNQRTGVWTLRTDGILLWGTPDGPLEEFDTRPLTAHEKENGFATYLIEGEKFKFKYRDGSDSEGEVTYSKDGGIELIKASALRFGPVGPLKFPLTGNFTCTTVVNNAAYAVSTTAWKGYSFYANGAFVLEAGASTTCSQVEDYGDMQREVMKVYGNEAKSRMGKFKVEGSGLTLTFDDGRVEKHFIGQQFDAFDDGTVLIMIGRGRYEGRPGKFPGEAEVCRTDTCELRLPKGWKETQQTHDGLKVHTLVPGDASAGLAILAIGLDVDAATQARTEGTAKELREAVGAFVGYRLESAGDLEEIEIDGAAGVRIPSTFQRDGATLRCDALYAVKSGRALFLIALGTLEGAQTFAGDLRQILNAARFARDETAPASTDDFSVQAPKAWKATASKDAGTTTLTLAPKKVAAGDFFAAIVSQPTEFKSARDKKAVAWLREQVAAAVPGAEKQGDPEKLTVDGAPAIGLTYAGAHADGTVVVVHLYAVVRHGRVAMLFTGGRRELVEKHSGAARRAFETLRMKEGK